MPGSKIWFHGSIPISGKQLSDALETPICTGEDIYMLKGGFKPLIDAHAVDIIQPDLGTSGGLLETKKIGDYAEENGIAMAMHMAGSPVCFHGKCTLCSSYTELSGT